MIVRGAHVERSDLGQPYCGDNRLTIGQNGAEVALDRGGQGGKLGLVIAACGGGDAACAQLGHQIAGGNRPLPCAKD